MKHDGWGSMFGTADNSGFRNLEYWITKVELFDFSIFEFFKLFLSLFKLFEHSKSCMIIYHQIRNFRNFDSFANRWILKICYFWNSIISEIWFSYEYADNENLMIFEIVKMENFWNFFSIWKAKIWFQQLANFDFVRPFDIPHYSQFGQLFSYLIFEILKLIPKNF